MRWVSGVTVTIQENDVLSAVARSAEMEMDMEENARTSFLNSLNWQTFSKDKLKGVPRQQGVYFLAQKSPKRILYVGCSDTAEDIRRRLEAHLSGKSNIAQAMAEFKAENPDAKLDFAFIAYSGISDPRAGEDFFLDLFGGRKCVPFNRKGTARRIRNRIFAHQYSTLCPGCGRPY